MVEFWEAVQERKKLLEADRQREFEYAKLNAELMRSMTTHLVNINLPRNKRVRPQKLMPFTWDKSQQQQSAEQMKKVLKAIARATQGRKTKAEMKLLTE